MTTYTQQPGTHIPVRAADPTNPIVGEVWYNTTTNQLKGVINVASATWATGGSMNTARRQVAGFGEGVSTAVVTCGQNPPALNLTEEYSGTAWTAVTANPEVRVKPFGFGTNSAGLVGGGESGPSSGTNSGEYDGTSWTASATIPLTMYDSTGTGTTSAGVVVHGPQSPNTAVLLYATPGTWTTGTSSPEVIGSASAGGTTTAAVFTAKAPGNVTTSYDYAGGTWTAGGALNQARNRAATGAQSPVSQVLLFGGNTAPAAVVNNTEEYNGTSWTAKAAMSTARRGLGGSGSSNTSALAFGGFLNPGDTAATEEYAGGATTKIFSIS